MIRASRRIAVKCRFQMNLNAGLRCFGFLMPGLVFSVGLTPARAATWYVSTTGNDTQAGTLAAPFRTIQRAADVMAPGDTCLIRQGTYRETVRPVASGTSAAPMIFSPYNGEAVTVSGCDIVTGWQNPSGYKKMASTDFALQAEAFSSMSGVVTMGTVIGFCDDGDWIRFNGVNLGSGCTTLRVRMAVPASNAGRPVEIRLGSPTGRLVGTLTTAATGSWDTYTEQTTTLTGAVDNQTVYCVFKGGGGVGNFDWFRFERPDVTQVFVNGLQMPEAQFPNRPLSAPMLTKDYRAALTTYDNKTAVVDGASRPDNYWVGGRVMALSGANWVTVYGRIDSSTGNTVHVTDTSAHWSSWGGGTYLGAGFGTIFGVLGELDSAGEWFYGADTLHLWAPGNADPATVTVEARTRRLGFDLSGRSHIELRDIHLKACTISLRDSNACIVDGGSVRYPREFFRWTNGFLRDNHIDPNTWEGTGLEVSGSGNTIRDAYIAHSWGDGVSIWGSNNTLENCLIEDVDWSATDCAAVTVRGTGHAIRNSTLRNSARSLLVHRLLEGGSIRNNHLHDGGIICDDLGLTYTYEDRTASTEIAYNWLHDNHTYHVGPGIYIDNNCSHKLIHHNVVWRCHEALRLNGTCADTDVFNNTFWDNVAGMAVWYAYDGLVDVRVWNNLGNRDDFKGNDLQANLYSLATNFTDPGRGNYSLRTDAPAANAGIAISGITDGYAGSAPDIGAYESGVTPWTAGANFTAPGFEDTVPPAPANLRVRPLSPYALRLDWDSVPWATGYLIEGRTNDSVFELVGTTSAWTTSIEEHSLYPGTFNEYRVTALSAAGNSISCRPVSAVTLQDGTFVHLEAEQADIKQGVSTDKESIGSADYGDYVAFQGIDFDAGHTRFVTRMAVPSPYAGQTAELRLDSPTGTLIGQLVTSATGGWETFAEQTTPLSSATGRHSLYIVFKGGSGVGAFDWFRLEGSADAALAPARLQAEAFSTMQGVVDTGGGIGFCDNGDWVKFSGVNLGIGRGMFAANLAVPSEYAGQKIEVRLDSPTGLRVGEITTQSTGSWSTYQEQFAYLSGATGIRDVYVIFRGGSGIGSFDWFEFRPSVGFQAEAAAAMSGVGLTGSGIGSCDDGDWVKFNSVSLDGGYALFLTRMAVPASHAGQRVEIRLDSVTGPLAGTLITASTGGWWTYAEQYTQVSGAVGTHDIYVVFRGGSGIGDFDWFQFEVPVSPAPVRLQAEQYSDQLGISNSNTNIGFCDHGDWILFRNVNLGNGQGTFESRLAVPASHAGQSIDVRLDSPTGTVIGTLVTSATGGWDVFAEQTTPLSGGSGTHDIYIKFRGMSGIGSFDWFGFRP